VHPARPEPPPKPQYKPRISIVQVLACAIGGMVFVAVNGAIYLSSCRSNEFMVTCSTGDGSHSGLVIMIAAALGIAAVVSHWGKSFAAGFGGALIALSIVTMGSCTDVWLDPYYAARQKTLPARLAREAAKKREATKQSWVTTMNARPMDVARGVEFAGSVMQCAQNWRAQRGSFPATEAELAVASCPSVRFFRAAVEPDGGRYAVPAADGGGDAGWRMTYASTASGFVVDVTPASELGHTFPRMHASSDGRVDVTMTSGAAPLTVTPAEDLRQLVECLKGLPAEEERVRLRRGGLSYGWFLTSRARRLCPGLAGRLKAPIPNDENTTLVTLVAPMPAGPVTLATYVVRFEIRQPANQPFAFDLHARAKVEGLPRYLATFEGVLHTTVAWRDVLTSDPVVSRQP
jgi:hypothetical protein